MNFKIITTVMMAAAFVSCSKEKTEQNNDPGAFKVTVNGKLVSVNNLPADTIIGFAPSGQPFGAGVYSFFSLENNKWIANSDSATTKWDLAFSGTTIRVNNTTGGPGNGGAFVYTGTFDALTSVPQDSVFKVDNHPVSYAIPRGSGKGWYHYDGATNLLTPVPGRVLVIRTASGKYAKLEILNYYRGGITPPASASDEIKISEQRYYSFRYTYQGNGTTTF